LHVWLSQQKRTQIQLRRAAFFDPEWSLPLIDRLQTGKHLIQRA
jgi:hypothetical protein